MKFGRSKIVTILFAAVLFIGMVCAPFVYGTQPQGGNSWDNLQPGEMHLLKKAERIPGKVNSWKITVTAEGRDEKMPVDFLIVFDKSASMNDYAKDDEGNQMTTTRLQAAQSATNELIDDIFADNEDNRVGFISYSSAIYNADTLDYNPGTTHVTVNNQLSDVDDASVLHSTVNDIKGKGGTNTQLALHEAGEMMTQAHQADPDNGRRRVIILLTDGIPTMGVPVDWDKVKQDNPEVFTQENATETQARTQRISSSGKPIYIDNITGNWTYNAISSDGKPNQPCYYLKTERFPDDPKTVVSNTDGIPEEAFNYDDASQHPLGWGSARWVNTEETVSYNGEDQVIYADLLQNTVAEANFIRNRTDGNGNPDVDAIHVIAYDADSELETILRHITNNNDDFYHPASGESVGDAMTKILNIEGSKSSTAALLDEIPVGFGTPIDIETTSGTAGYKNGVINWDIGTPTATRAGTDPVVRYAELSYVLTVDGSETMAGVGPFDTNGTTKIDYTTPSNTDETSEVESPQVDTIAYEVTKNVIDAPAGENESFTVKITGPGNYSQEFDLQNNQTKKFANFTDIGTYTVEEIVDQNKYDVEYWVNGSESNTFTIEWGTDDVLQAGNHVAITIKNTRKYNVTHEFVSGTEGKELPEEVTNLTPADQTGKTNGTEVTPTQPTQTEVVVEGGKWVFEGYDRDNDTIDKADENFTGTWTFVEETQSDDSDSEIPNPEYPDSDEPDPNPENPTTDGPKPQDPTPENPSDEGNVLGEDDVNDSNSGDDVSGPNTGDSTDVGIWVVLMMISGASLIGVNTARKKQKNS